MSNYRYIQDDDGQWHRVSNSEEGRIFQGLTVTPRKVKYKYIPKKIDNSIEAAKQRDKFLETHKEDGSLKYERGLEQVSPEFDLITLGPILKWLGQGIKTVLTKAPEKLRSYSWTDLYNASTKQWDSDKLLSMVQKGKEDAVAYFNSDAFRKTQEYNKKLAQKLGYNNYTPYTEAAERADIVPRIQYTNTASSEAGNAMFDMNPSKDLVGINLFYNPETTMFHESIHRGYLGAYPNTYLSKFPRQNRLDTQAFNNMLTEKTLKPTSQLYNEGLLNTLGEQYLSHPHELATNLLEAGRRMGIKPGDPFPGKQKFLEMIDQFKKANKDKGELFSFLNLEHPVRVWRGLNGTLFTGATLLNINQNYE